MTTTTNTERTQDYITSFINRGGMYAIQHEANCVYTIGSSFEALIEDFSYQYEEPTLAECTHVLNELSNYCLEDNDGDFYDNVALAIKEVLECI